MKSLFSIAVFLALSIKPDPVAESVPTPTPTPEVASGEEKNVGDVDLSAVDVGIPVKGIKIPYFDDDGVTLKMTFEAAEARRIDDENIELTNLLVKSFDEESDFRASFEQAVLNISTRVLEAQRGVEVKRDDFSLKADKGEFDTKARSGKVFGNIVMVIYNTDEIEIK